MSEITTPTREIEVKILSNTYKVGYPKTGQMIRIQTSKLLFGNGVYQDLIMASSDALFVRFIIDAISTFQVLIPQLTKDLNRDYMELDLMETKEIVKAYTDIYLPWYQQWSDIVQGNAETKEAEPAQ